MAGEVDEPGKTTWEVWTYDVWGNERDGFEVNDRHCVTRKYQTTSSDPTEDEIREALGIKPGWPIEVNGDDWDIYVNCGKTDLPLGELVKNERWV